jgi:hypothetical protein
VRVRGGVGLKRDILADSHRNKARPVLPGGCRHGLVLQMCPFLDAVAANLLAVSGLQEHTRVSENATEQQNNFFKNHN